MLQAANKSAATTARPQAKDHATSTISTPSSTTSAPTRPKTTQMPTRAPTRPTRPQQQQPSKQTRPDGFHEDGHNKRKQCRGECVSGLFALFCDDLDSDAFCPGEGSCCITGGDSPEASNDNQVAPPSTTTPRPPPTPVRIFPAN